MGEWIVKRNTELEHMQVGLNAFADLTQEEFEDAYLTNFDAAQYNATIHDVAEPIAIDDMPTTSKGKCATPIRNQGQCGSCWAFAASCTTEAWLCLESEDEENAYKWVSPQELVDCTCSGCNGGWPHTAISYYAKNQVCEDSEYKYTARKGSCQSSKCKRSGVSGYRSVQDKGGGLTKALSTNFVAICIDAGGLDFRFYKSGTFMPGVNCNKHSVNHAVTAVEAKGSNYHVKNSWGGSWGSGGYFDMPAGVNCLGVNNQASVYTY